MIKHHKTILKSIRDFPAIEAYLQTKFPKMDLSSVKIYIASSKAMDRAGFGSCAGCYIDHMKIILIRENPEISGGDTTNKFQRIMDQEVRTTLRVEDIVVHEMLHAASSLSRSGRSFTFGEEEFVYSNCVEFYKQEGQTEEQIVNGTFLPFCVNDVMSDQDRMKVIWEELRKKGYLTPLDKKMTNEEYRRFNSRYASFLVPKIVSTAREMGFKMIELFNKYGSATLHGNQRPTNDTKDRVRSIDMDFDDDF